MARAPKLFTVVIYRPNAEKSEDRHYCQPGLTADDVGGVVRSFESRPDAASGELRVFAGAPQRVEGRYTVTIGESRKPRAAKPAVDAPRKPGRPPGSRNKSKVAPAPEATATAKGAA